MAIVVDRTNANRAVDRTQQLQQIPNQWGFINSLGLFEEEYPALRNVEITKSITSDHILVDRNWDQRNNTIVSGEEQYLQLKIPHFPADDAITPNDIQGLIAVPNATEAMNLETVARVRARKMVALRRAHALTLEAARMQLITTGNVYAPSGTLRTNYGPTVNFYTEWGVTRDEIEFDFSGVNDPRVQIDELYGNLQDSVLNGGIYNGMMALCSSEFFTALAMNPYVTDVLKAVGGRVSFEMLVGRPTAAGLDSRYRSFEFGGITFVDVGRSGYTLENGTTVRYVPAGDAYVFPVGMDNLFTTYFAPANTFSAANQRSQGSYWREYASDKDELIEIMTEQNFLNTMNYPQSVKRLFLA